MTKDKWQRLKEEHEDKLIDFIDEEEIGDELIDVFLLMQITSELFVIRKILAESLDA